MENAIKELWDNYGLEKCNTIDSKEEKELLALVVETEEKLRHELSESQIKLLEKLTDNINDLNMFALEKSFTLGICFATSYMTETLK